MRKTSKQISQYGRVALPGLAAVSFSLVIALFGCTTNKTPGDGQPISSPIIGPTNVSATPGSSSGTSYVRPQAMLSSWPAAWAGQSRWSASDQLRLDATWRTDHFAGLPRVGGDGDAGRVADPHGLR